MTINKDKDAMTELTDLFVLPSFRGNGAAAKLRNVIEAATAEKSNPDLGQAAGGFGKTILL